MIDIIMVIAVTVAFAAIGWLCRPSGDGKSHHLEP